MILSPTVAVADTTAGKTATASASASVRIAFGINNAIYPKVSPGLPGITFTKAFASSTDGANGVPTVWPGAAGMKTPAGTTTLACFEPDPAMVLTGDLDDPLTAYFGLAPPGSWSTAWQEGNGLWQAVWADGFTVADWQAMHIRLNRLAAVANPGLRYGQVLSTLPVRQGGKSVTPYVVPGLSWYSMDGYDSAGDSTPEAVFGETWSQILGAEPSARCAITETNSTDTTGEWFTGCWEWLTSNNGVLFSTFWTTPDAPGQQLYPWPPSAAALAALQSVSEQCAA